ncbi:TetR/AcrR family transcriptional regulator [Actinomadura gamaensis]|uniref:TetR/AcrR family transcriptional regulator n=1 Tax=Actinomadura gamaensis TaxID=1763541 RepID=A0ABV9TUE8_9ACTN
MIMAAAVRVIAEQGLSAPTAAIAKEAGVSNGTLFNVFPTKTDLINHLFVDLKSELGATVTADLPADADLREQGWHVWCRWTAWGTSDPRKKRALAQLSVSRDVTPDSHAAAYGSMAEVAALLDRARATGALRDAPMAFVVRTVEALADTTIAFMIQDPRGADRHRATGFEALWRAVT